MTLSPDALVVGAGPAGLMAADILSAGGARVLLAEAKPSVGRKFLMAGKSGLNLTKDEARDAFHGAFSGAEARLRPILDAFGPAEVRAWSEALGQPVFTGSSGRVFPVAMKASPLLRALLARLRAQGVDVRTRWRWRGPGAGFFTPEGPVEIAPRETVLALGGASWARLGSDGAWAEGLAGAGVPIAPFKPANAGLTVAWSPHMAPYFGHPVKSCALVAGGQRVRGEFVISRRGLEGGGIYAIFASIREGAPLTLDLAPDLDEAEVARRLSRPRGKTSLANHLRKSLKLDPARRALLMEFARPPSADPAPLAACVKALPVGHAGPPPMDEAISTAGGIGWDGLGSGLEIRALPGHYAAGEMIDWEAPTGGYLITACLATGRWAGQAALQALRSASTA